MIQHQNLNNNSFLDSKTWHEDDGLWDWYLSRDSFLYPTFFESINLYSNRQLRLAMEKTK